MVKRRALEEIKSMIKKIIDDIIVQKKDSKIETETSITDRFMQKIQDFSFSKHYNNISEDVEFQMVIQVRTLRDRDITINIVDSAIRHYRKSGLVRRKHNPYINPFQYELSKKGKEKLEWLENEEYLNYIY